MSAVVKLDTTGLDEIAAKLDMRTEQVLKACAFQVEAEAKTRVKVVTGYLKNSIKARRINSKTYHVDVGAEYGARIEFGFHDTDILGRRYNQAAQPYLTPAVEKVRQHLDDLYKRLFP